jgi:HCOMODA/2-hydroxy-3-carboxy-muconic semialdehyde decarboxylase
MTASMHAAAVAPITAVDDVLAACRVLDGAGLTDAFGHLSCRDEHGDVLLTARIGPGLVREPAQVLRLTLSGELLSGDPALIPGEASLHFAPLRARQDVVSVCRFHGAACFAWSTLGRPLPATTGLSLMLGGEVPVYDAASTITTDEEAERVVAALAGGSAILLRGFGALTVGSSVAEAVVRATFLERAAAMVLSASVVGEARAYSAEQAAAFAARSAVITEQVARAWTYLCDRYATP